MLVTLLDICHHPYIYFLILQTEGRDKVLELSSGSKYDYAYIYTNLYMHIIHMYIHK
jgi:hypothetical protein